MPKIKWVGIIRDTDIYQTGVLPAHAVQLRIPRNLSGTMTAGTPFILPPILLCCGSVFLKTLLTGRILVHPLWIFAGVVLGFVCMLLHELLHAVVYPKDAYVYIGIVPKNFAAVALASHPMKRKRFLLMTLLPAVLGILPLLLFWILPATAVALNSIMFGLAIMGLVSPYVDYFIAYQVYRQVPSDCFVQNEKDEVYYFTKEAPPVRERLRAIAEADAEEEADAAEEAQHDEAL